MYYTPNLLDELKSLADLTDERLFGPLGSLQDPTILSAIRSDLLSGPAIQIQRIARLRFLLELIVFGTIGRTVSFTDAPEVVIVGKRLASGTCVWRASGVLLSPSLVLTAGHALGSVTDRASIVAFGAQDVFKEKKKDQESGEVIGIKDSFEHPRADLALLRLEKPVSSAPAGLAVASGRLVDRALATRVVGFGASFRDCRVGRKTALVVPVTALWRDRRLPRPCQLERTLGFSAEIEFCAGAVGFDTCPGDSGAPAYVLGNDARWRLAGITSRATEGRKLFGPCGDGGVYTRIDTCWASLEAQATRWKLSLPPLAT